MVPSTWPKRKVRRRRFGCVERCEPRYCLSAIGFTTHDIIKSDASGVSDVQVGDIDGDGDLDVVSASISDDKISWFENKNGHFFIGSSQHLITSRAKGAHSVQVGDLDGDGDLDVLSFSLDDGKIAWYRNSDGAGNFTGPRVIATVTTGIIGSLHPMTIGDLDGDGDLDVITASWFGHATISWHENNGSGQFQDPQVIANPRGARSVMVADLDGDGDLDVITGTQQGSCDDFTVAWHENIGPGNFGPEQVIISYPGCGSSTLTVGDLDGDGDMDILSAYSYDNDKLYWYENNNGTGRFGPERVIADDFGPVTVADLDGDGDQDVLSGSSWYENTDGEANFGPAQEIMDSSWHNAVGDIDGDGDLDVLSAAGDTIAWHANDNGTGSFGPPRMITRAGASGAASVTVGDLDGDGDLEVLSAAQHNNEIAWYENADFSRGLGPRQVITRDARGAKSVMVGDLDGDGDLDVLSGSRYDRKVAWYENSDGAGSFGPQQVIATDSAGVWSVNLGDLDGDGDLDVLSASEDSIAWYENSNGTGDFGPPQLITNRVLGVKSVTVGDLDGDGDLDVLSASSDDDKIAWYENTDGAGSFGRQQVITGSADGAWSVTVGDLDGDGDLDVISASSDADTIAWYKNIDGAGSFSQLQERLPGDANGDGMVGFSDFIDLAANFGLSYAGWEGGDFDNDGKVTLADFSALASNFGRKSPTPVITDRAGGARAVFASDMDGDGDIDVVSASSDTNTIAWHENIGGIGGFGPQQVISTDALGASSVSVGDLDGDGDLDVVSASGDDDKIAWYESDVADIAFVTHEIAETVPADMHAADVDGDGDQDVVAIFFEFHEKNARIAWVENVDGLGDFGPEHLIMAGDTPFYWSDSWFYVLPRHRFIETGDVDGDGDVDVLSASFVDAGTVWFENIDGRGDFGVAQRISPQVGSILATEIDGDGDVDVVVSSSEGDVIWYENSGDLAFTQRQISTQGEAVSFAGDVDGDGDTDLLATYGSAVALWENEDGRGSFGQRQTVFHRDNVIPSVSAADIDGDGDLDLLPAVYYGGGVLWYENTRFGAERVFDFQWNVGGMFGSDMDGDGDLDVVTSSSTHDEVGIAWFENRDGHGNLGKRSKIKEFAEAFAIADIDGDGDLDLLGASSSSFMWIENRSEETPALVNAPTNSIPSSDGRTEATDELLVPSDELQTPITHSQSASTGTLSFAQHRLNSEGTIAVSVADFDGDGDLDITSASYLSITWHENRDGQGDFAAPKSVAALNYGIYQYQSHGIVAADLDGDGDTDMASATYWDRTTAWYENTDGQGTFGPRAVITSVAGTYGGAESIAAVDMDGDGAFDLLTDDGRWYANAPFGPRSPIPRVDLDGDGESDLLSGVVTADLDGDGDPDLVSEEIAWYANDEGQVLPGSKHDIDSPGSEFRGFRRAESAAADIDGDGDLDLVSSIYSNPSNHGAEAEIEIVWHENIDGRGNFGPRQEISSQQHARSLLTADVDADGDADLVAIIDSRYPPSSSGRLVWFENLNGQGTFGPQQLIAANVDTVFVADLDADGDPDFVTGAIDDSCDDDADTSLCGLSWNENRLAGDVDDDGVVAFPDFLALAQNFGRDDAEWKDGDLDGDGTVAFADFLILATNFGNARPPAQPVSMSQTSHTATERVNGLADVDCMAARHVRIPAKIDTELTPKSESSCIN